MRFKDEKELWYAETEELAARLANKSRDEIMDIFNESDVIKLRSCDRPTQSVVQRLAALVVFPFLLKLFCIKWVLTGQGHLDSWAKKSKLLRAVFKCTGIN